MLRLAALCAASLWVGLAGVAVAQDVRITEEMSDVSFSVNGQTFTIARNQDTSAQLSGEFTKTSRACPPFCIHPITVAPGVETVGELDVIAFLQSNVSSGSGLLVDARVPEFFVQGAIPGAINIPFSTLEADNPYREDILYALGATHTSDGLDFSNALTLMVYCNGAWDDQSTRAIKGLLQAGYPADRLQYYRGGMQDWSIMGLTTVTPQSGG